MSLFSRRSGLGSALLIGMLPTSLLAADKPKEIPIDWATYNPVSMVLKEKGLATGCLRWENCSYAGLFSRS